MDTTRLRKLQQPSHIENLLKGLLSGSDVLPPGAYEIRDQASVPRELRRIALRATQKGEVWSCWAHSFRTWLFTGEMSLPLSRERGVPVLLVSRYDDGGLQDSASWRSDRNGKWLRCDE
jgi:hypothetical protein